MIVFCGNFRRFVRGAATPQSQGIIANNATNNTPKGTASQQNNQKPSPASTTVGKMTTPIGVPGVSAKSSGSPATPKPLPTSKVISNVKAMEVERKSFTASVDAPKRAPKRTRGSMSVESNSPSTTPPPTHTKRRRI